MRKAFVQCICSWLQSIACPNHNNGYLYTPRRKAGCLLLLQSDNVTTQSYTTLERSFHHSYSQNRTTQKIRKIIDTTQTSLTNWSLYTPLAWVRSSVAVGTAASQLLSKNFEVCSSKNIHVFMRHKHLMFNTLETQYALCQYWYMKIEQFSSLNMKDPRNILATFIQSSIA